MTRPPAIRALAAAAVLLLGACSSGGSAHRSATSAGTSSSSSSSSSTTTTTDRPSFASPCGRSSAPPSTDAHVIWIWMENHPFDKVIGSADAPVASRLAHECGTATDYRTVGRPSLPNYIGATSGATHGIADDGGPSHHPLTVDNLFRQVRDSGRTERSYEEDMPAPCALTPADPYAVKHNPAAYYEGGHDRAACRADDLPLGTPSHGTFATELANGDIPAFTFITPNLCDDTHDCAVGVGDAWLGRWLHVILDSPVYRRGRTTVFVVWDEPTPMPDLVISPTTPAGTRLGTPVDHYALLRTTEELLGLPHLLGAAASSPSLRGPFRL